MTPNETILSFLNSCAVAAPRKLDVASVYAESMIHELTTALAEWKAVATALETMKRENIVAN
jgi:hypothetical protein